MSSFDVEKLVAVEKEGIEFYVNNDGTKTGMSQRGLARFCGVARTTLHDLLVKLSEDWAVALEGLKRSETLENKEFKVGRSSVPQCLVPHVGVAYIQNVETESKAKIIDSKVCEALVYYFGYIGEVNKETQVISRESHRKFAQMGLHEWIKKTVGVIERHDSDELKLMMSQILSKIDSLEKVTTEYKAIRERTTSHYLGMDQLLTDLQKEQNLLEPTLDGSLSLEGYLYKTGITLSKPRFRSLAILVGQTYKSLTGVEPEKTHFTIEGKTKYNVFVYQPIYFPMLNMCLTKVIAGQF